MPRNVTNTIATPGARHAFGSAVDKPCAAPGLVSYRYEGRYGFIMIGATDDAEALREAARSATGGKVDADKLQRWDAARGRYTPLKVAPMQLEVWEPKGRKGGAWKVAPLDAPRGKAWRMVKVGHSHKDKFAHSITMRDVASVRDAATVCREYCTWAKARGLTSVHVYRDGGKAYVSQNAAREQGLSGVAVDYADHLGSAPAAELDEQAAA